MKMPDNQASENNIFDYEEASYMAAPFDNPEFEDVNSSPENDFSEYLWMENEEEFDKEVLQRLEEEALMEECMEAMLADENGDSSNNRQDILSDRSSEMPSLLGNLRLDGNNVVAQGSNLNPLAAEFVPSGRFEKSQNSSA